MAREALLDEEVVEITSDSAEDEDEDAQGIKDITHMVHQPLLDEEVVEITSDSAEDEDEDAQGIKDITHMVRKALLNTNFAGGVRVALVISSLSITSFGKTDSDRGVSILSLPERLDSGAIVAKWWKMNDRDDFELCTLDFIAKTVNNMPRAASFINDYLRNDLGGRPIDKTVVSELFQSLFLGMSARYSAPWPQSNLTYPVIFREGVKLGDKGVMDALRSSIFTNVPKTFSSQLEFTPESSLVMLRTAAARSSNKVAVVFRNSIDSVISKTAIIQNSDIGALLETLYVEWLFIRIATAFYHRKVKPTITVEKLLGITEVIEMPFGLNDDLLKALKAEIYLPPMVELPPRLTLPRYSGDCKSDEEFFEDLEKVNASYSNPFTVIIPCITSKAGKESFDVCLKAFIPGNDKPLYVFIDCKSASESTVLERKDPKYVADVLNRPYQYAKINAFAKKKNLQFLYIYQTTYYEPSALVGNEGTGILIGRDETITFFGPAAEFYCALRDSLPEIRKLKVANNDENLAPSKD
jgi:hypothetical protein